MARTASETLYSDRRGERIRSIGPDKPSPDESQLFALYREVVDVLSLSWYFVSLREGGS
jgi:hypothetical protein